MKVWAGTAVLSTATFTDATGTATDPTTVTLEWRIGGGEVTTWTYDSTDNITRTGTGVYSATITTTGASSTTVVLKWRGEGACAAVEVASFQVQNPPF